MISVQTEERQGVLIVRPLLSRLDAAAAPELRRQILAAVTGQSVVVLALENVEFVDSSGLGSLVSIVKQLPAGGRLRLTGVQPRVQSLLRVTRLDRVFLSFETIEAALAA